MKEKIYNLVKKFVHEHNIQDGTPEDIGEYIYQTDTIEDDLKEFVCEIVEQYCEGVQD